MSETIPQTAADVMTSAVVTVAPDVAKLMAREGIRRVLVLRDGALAGIVSRRDLVRSFAQAPRS